MAIGLFLLIENQTLTAQTPTAQNLLEEGDTYLKQGNFEEAIKSYETLLKNYPKAKEVKKAQKKLKDPKLLAYQRAQPAMPYTGNGGKGMSLAILAPKGNSLAAAQNYLPDLVQGEFVSNFSGYSAISVMDRVNLEKVILETLDPIYKDNLDIVRLGHVVQTGYIMTGTITKTASGYALQVQITSTADGTTKASYSGNCTAIELDNLTGVRRASLELLDKMDVQLTEQAKRELSGAGQVNYVNAQTALAQGIVAQRSGNTVETMAHFYEAAAYDPSFAEAASRANTMSASIRTGSLRENIRSDIAWRDEWVKILADAKKFLLAHPPVMAQVIYDPALRQGKTDYNSRTVDFEFDIEVKGVPYPPAYNKMAADLNAGLDATGRNGDWGLKPLSLRNIWSQVVETRKQIESVWIDIHYTAELVNSGGKVIAKASEGIKYDKIREHYIRGIDVGLGRLYFRDTGTRPDLDLNEEGRYSYGPLYPFTICFTVKADDISDQMTIRLSAKAKGGRLRDGSETGDIPEYPVEVITRGAAMAQAMAQATVNGLPPMITRTLIVGIFAGPSPKISSMTVEIPSTRDEYELLLSYRPSLSDGHGVLIGGTLTGNHVEGLPKYIDTTHYRFPVSVAYICFVHAYFGGGSFMIRKIINIEPGRREPVPEEIKFLGVGIKVDSILIVPKGWFKRAGIRTDDNIGFTTGET